MFKPVRARGLDEVRRAFKRAEELTPDLAQEVSKEAAELALSWARGEIPQRTGNAASTLKVIRLGRQFGLQGGDATTAPYYPWLDFGGRVGRRHSVVRQYLDSGRYIYPGFVNTLGQAENVMERALSKMIYRAGLGG